MLNLIKKGISLGKTGLFLIIILFLLSGQSYACSIVYYINGKTGQIFVANNEDYFYSVRPYIKVEPQKGGKLGRLWYGWKNFAQGGVNEAGLFFDGASTPGQTIPSGYKAPQKNIGDDILATCRTVEEAIDYLEKHRIALENSHFFLGDKTGTAVVIEWVNGEKVVHKMESNKLIATNFLLSDTSAGNYPCLRYSAIRERLDSLDLYSLANDITLNDVGNAIASAVQLPQKDSSGKTWGTLYSTFIDLTNKQFVLVYKLDNSRIYRINLHHELATGRSRKIKLK